MNYLKPRPGHVNCVSCRRVDVPGCEECRRCKGECGCICRDCPNCTPTILRGGVRVLDKAHFTRHHPKYFCPMCGLCKRHNADGMIGYTCNCRRRPSGISDTGEVTTSFHFNELPRKLGLEVECSYLGTTRLQVPPFVRYQWTHDGSITPGGQELVLAPLQGDQFLQGITALAGQFAQYGFQADSSCGLHVHVGVKDWGAFELRRLILLYHTYEDLFYKLVAKGRDGYRLVRDEKKYYARRWDRDEKWLKTFKTLKDPSDIRRTIVESLYKRTIVPHQSRKTGELGKIKIKSVFNGGHSYCVWPKEVQVEPHGYRNMSQIAAHKYEACRYYGLNLHTFFQRNTVEYRHHEGTVALDKLLYWPLWCGWFTELASVLTDTEISHLYSPEQLINGEWCRPGRVVSLPQPVRDWVWRTLQERGQGIGFGKH